MAIDIEKILRDKFMGAVQKLPPIIKNEAVNISMDAFKTESWDGQKWPARKKGSKRNQGRALLVDTARLKRSIPINTTIDGNIIYWGSDVPYASIHNDGGIIHQHARSETFRRNRISRGKNKGHFKKGTSAGQGHTYKERNITIPQRRFIGDSPTVRERLIKKAKQFLIKELKR